MLRIQVHDQGTSSHDFSESENMHELSTIITDVYSLAGEKFGHDLLHLIGRHMNFLAVFL